MKGLIKVIKNLKDSIMKKLGVSPKETPEERSKRILELCEDGDYGICAPPMDAQVALNELTRYLLGENWYVTMPLHQTQINTEIVYEIESKYKDVNRKKRNK